MGYETLRLDEDILASRLAMIGYKWIGGEYYNFNSRLILEDEHGFKYEATWQHINNRGKTLKEVHKLNPYSIDNIKIWLKTNLPHLTLLSQEYTTTRQKLKLHCSDCNQDFESAWTNLSSNRDGKKCPVCSRRIAYVNEDVLKVASGCNDTIIFTNPTRAGDGNWVMDCKCSECGREWVTKLYTIQRGSGCADCNRGGGYGGYNYTTAERNKAKWLKMNAIVYIISCQNENESFVKIGITATSIESRFVGKKKFPYTIEVIDLIQTNLYDAVYMEKKLHDKYSYAKYSPKIQFDGYTECFESSIKEELIWKKLSQHNHN